MKKLCLALVLAVACKSSSSTTSQPSAQNPPPTPTTEPAPEPTAPPPTPAPTQPPEPTTDTPPAPAPTQQAGAKPAMGETCGDGDVCAQGLECVKYYGIAGARGPQFKSCEQRCDGKKATCPAGTKCVTVADGPGQVCRP